MASIETDIYAALAARLTALSWIKQVNYEKIKLNLTDFQEHELPAVQFYDEGQLNKHEQTRIYVKWDITLELIMKQTVSGVVDQAALFDKKHEIERQLGGRVQLGLTSVGMVQLTYPSALTDLHTFDPFYIARMTFTAEFYKPYTADC